MCNRGRIERIAITLSAALTARHFLMFFYYFEMHTFMLAPVFGVYIVVIFVGLDDTHVQCTWTPSYLTLHFKETQDTWIGHATEVYTIIALQQHALTTCINRHYFDEKGRRNRGKKQENRNKEELQNRTHTLTQSDRNQMCRLFANTSFNRLTPITILRFRSGT